jgi:hypothetical protein
MSTRYERNKWYKVSEPPKPEPLGSIYFVTKGGRYLAGTYSSYSQFVSLDEEVFESNQIENWKIRERKTNSKNPSSFNYNGKMVTLSTGQKFGFHWKASYENGNKEIYVNKESEEEAIQAIKEKIDCSTQ